MANDKIRALSDREQAREKLPIFFGSRDNYLHGFKEVMNNAIDEVLNNFPNGQVDIILHDDLETITVKDSGRGMPIADKNESGIPYYELIFTTLFAGGKYDETNNNNTGVNGVGNTTLNFTSDLFKVTSCNNGKKYIIEYEKGGKIKTPLTYIENTEEHSTEITFKLDETMYTNIKYNYEEIRDIIDKTAKVSSNINLSLTYNNSTETFHYDNLQDYFELHTNNNLIDTIIGSNKKYEETNGEITQVELVMSCSNEDYLLHECMLNGNNLIEKSSIFEGLLTGIRLFANKYSIDNNLYKKKEKHISNDDIENAIVFCCNVLSNRVEFKSQTKFSTSKKLYSTIVQKYIQELLEIYSVEHTQDFLKMVNHILICKRAYETAENSKNELKKKLSEKNKFTDNIENFYDCMSKDKNIKELYLCEGASAQGSIIQGRDSEFQASFHVGGKMLSLLKAEYVKIFKNTVVVNLFKILECGIEIKNQHNKDLGNFNINNLQWNKIILATDQDIDAYQIRCLMLTAIYRLAPKLIELGYVYIAESPLFEIEDENENVYFAYTEQEKEDIICRLKSKGIKFNKPERNKGLGQVSSNVIEQTMMNPKTRKITRITVHDIETMKKEFELWLGNNVSPRKKVITDNFNYEEHFDDEQEKDITKVLYENYLPYAIETIKERAIISIDGFKPAHRKLLWTLHEMNLYKGRKKSANIVGDNMAYNVHGDGSIYETLVRMAQKDTLNYPYVNGKGNFGQHTSKLLQCAHMRYTEAGASEINKEFFKNIEKNAIDFIPNFDGEKKEPSLLPTTFPNVLVNANEGIAVGMTSKTPSFNLSEVCDLTIAYLKNKNINVIDYLLSPDFATGGQVMYNKAQLEKIYNTGKGNISIRAKYKYNEKNNTIIITEIPYTTNRELIVKEIKDLCKNNKIKTITDIKDTTDKKGMSITINVKRNININVLMKQLFKLSPLEDVFSFNMNIICLDKTPKVLNIKQILDEWITFRMQCIKRVLDFDINEKSEKLHKLLGLKKILLNIEKAIEIIRFSETNELMLSNLMTEFNIDEIQAKVIIDRRLQTINENNIKNQIKDIDKLQQEIKELQKTIDSKDKINNIIISDLKRVKELYSKPRRTEIIYEDNIQEISTDDLIEDFNVHLTLTEDNYFKKTQSTSLRGSTSQKLKDNDTVICELDSTNKSDVLFFTNKCNCYKKHLYEFSEQKISNLGDYLVNELNLDTDEKIQFMIATTDYSENLIVCFKTGKLAKIPLSSYFTKQNRTKLMNALSDKSKVINMFIIKDDIDIICQSSINKILITNSSVINFKNAKNTSGVQILKSKNDSTMILCEPLTKIYANNFIDINYYKSDSGKGIGCYLKKGDSIERI